METIRTCVPLPSNRHRDSFVLDIERGSSSQDIEPGDTSMLTVGRKPKPLLYEREVQRRLLLLVFHCLMSLVPAGIAALGLSFSHPTKAVLISVYAATGAISLAGIVYSICYFDLCISRVIERRHRLYMQSTPAANIQHQQISVGIPRVAYPTDAFDTRQRWYLNRHTLTSPTLVSPSLDIPGSADMAQTPDGRRLSPRLSLDYANVLSLPEIRPLPPLHIPEIVHIKIPYDNSPVFIPLQHSNDSGVVTADHCTTTAICQPPTTAIDTARYSQANNRYSASTSCVDGLRKSLEAESIFDIEDDEESIQLLTFDKVKIQSACSLVETYTESQKPSSSTRQHQSCMHMHVYTATNHRAFVNYMTECSADTRKVQCQHQYPMLVPAEQLSPSFSSIPANSSYPLVSPGSIASMISRLPKPPTTTAGAGASHQTQTGAAALTDGDEDDIEKWLISSAPIVYHHPTLRTAGYGMLPISLIVSNSELAVPEKFRSPNAGTITVATGNRSKTRHGKSIYGERNITESDSSVNIPVDRFISDILYSPQSRGQNWPTNSSIASLRPLQSAVNLCNSSAARLVTNGVGIDTMVARLNYAIELADVSSNDDSSPDTVEMVGLDEPLLESTDLCLRRATLMNYQKKISSHGMRNPSDLNKRAVALDIPISRTTADGASNEHLHCSVISETEHSIKDALFDSRYFSAVSLPQPQGIAARILDSCIEEEEEEEEIYADMSNSKLAAEASEDKNSALSPELNSPLGHLTSTLSKLLANSRHFRAAGDDGDNALQSIGCHDGIRIGIHSPSLNPHRVEQEEIPPMRSGDKFELSAATLDEDAPAIVRVT